METTGTECWAEEWCTAYNERLVPLHITGYMRVPNKLRDFDPDFEEDSQEACNTCEEWASICARRAFKWGLAGRLARHCPACGQLQV